MPNSCGSCSDNECDDDVDAPDGARARGIVVVVFEGVVINEGRSCEFVVSKSLGEV